MEPGGNLTMESGPGPGSVPPPPMFVQSQDNLGLEASTSGSQQDPEAILAEKVEHTACNRCP